MIPSRERGAGRPAEDDALGPGPAPDALRRERPAWLDGALAPAADLLEAALERAGLRGDRALAPFLAAAALALLSGAASCALLLDARLLAYLAAAPGLDRPVALAAGLSLALAPWALLSAMARRRRDAIARDLPFLLDLLVALVESGVAFDGALARLVDGPGGDASGRTPLEEELGRVQAELLHGVPRGRAFRALGARARLEELDIVVAAIVQGESQGGGIAPILRAQADALRARRLEEARERAQRLPIRLVFPLVACIFPSLFVVTLGPSLLRLLDLLVPLGRR